MEEYGTITSPGNSPYAMTVGATRTMNTPGRPDDAIANYSSKGPTTIDHIVKPDLVAAAARRTIAGYEAIHMMREGQVRWLPALQLPDYSLQHKPLESPAG